MGEEIPEGKLFGTFERHGEFVKSQQTFLSLNLFDIPSVEDDKEEASLFKKLSNILDEYQEQSYLLDPFLESLVAPIVECLKSLAKSSIAEPSRQASPERVRRVALLLYGYVKCRGYKTIIRFFPHEIADLSIALDFLVIPDGLVQVGSQWALRYVILIWLSLICMIPFDLSQFDDADRVGYTAHTIETSAKSFLGKAGLEREGAALLLSRLYMRKDTDTLFDQFLEWAQEQLTGHVDIFTSIGLLQVICEVVKSGPVEQLQTKVSQLFAISQAVESMPGLSNNTSIRKFRIKLVSRIAIRTLPAISNMYRKKGRTLTGTDINATTSAPEEDIDVPGHVEEVLEQLFEALQDKDTVVRWSAAKGVAHVSERLPTDFADQVMETIMGLFSIHSIAAASLYDLPAIAESTWHGACLACAEMARRGLVRSDRLPELIGWLSKALYFDLRKGAHSIGSNVRDAAAYVIWALGRTQDSSALIPHSANLAQRLIAVALFDREIHVRRAASAAFQEHVGRNGLFPHGIDVLAKTDFYAVGIRRNAYLTAAPQVAGHPEYCIFLLNHILDVTLRHWDPMMRELGSQSLHLICLLDLTTLGPKACHKAAKLLDSIDVTDLHGSLLAFAEVANAYRGFGDVTQQDVQMRNIFQNLSRIPFDVIVGQRNAIVTAAACRLISITVTLTEIKLEAKSSVPDWRKIIDHGLKHRNPVVQEAAADALASLKSSSHAVQQSLGTVLGVLAYDVHSNALPQALECLLDCAKASSSFKSNVEGRRNCYSALPRILSTVIHRLPQHMSSELVKSLYDTLLSGLEDYSIDERGDVGSWVRVACIRGLTSFSEILISNANSIPSLEAYLPSSKYQHAIAGILKQGVERLDNVRQEAGECFMRLFALPLPASENASSWAMRSSSLLRDLFQDQTEGIGWNDGRWLFPRAVRLLEVEEYRRSVLTGLVLSLSSKTDSTQRPAAASLVTYIQTLPILTEHGYAVTTFVEDLMERVRGHVTSNVIVVPVLKTFNVLLEGNSLARLSDDVHGLKNLRQLLSIVTRNVARLKSIPRIQESMKIVINLLHFESLFDDCIASLTDFLSHQFPSIRRDTAEYMYLVLQDADLDKDTTEAEDVLLETEWSSNDIQVPKTAADRVVTLLTEGELE